MSVSSTIFWKTLCKYWVIDQALVEKMRGVSRVTVYVGDDERENVLETLRIACEELREARRDVDFGTLAVSYTVTDRRGLGDPRGCDITNPLRSEETPVY